MEIEFVTITTEEYNTLYEAQRTLDALRWEGVENWEGYSKAMRLLAEEEEEL